MKKKFKLILLVLILTTSLINVSFIAKNKIPICMLKFKGNSDLKITSPDRLPKNAESTRPLQTPNGVVRVTRIDGYRILYNNSNDAPSLNLKVELSGEKYYANDQQGIIDNLKFLMSHSENLATSIPTELVINGYKIYGLNRNSIDTKSIFLALYFMFPGNNTTVFFDFYNLDKNLRTYNDLQEFITIRDRFFDEYTKHIKECKD